MVLRAMIFPFFHMQMIKADMARQLACPPDSSSETQEVRLDRKGLPIFFCVLVYQIACYRGKKVQRKLLGTAPRSVESGKMKQVSCMYSFHPQAGALMEHRLKKESYTNYCSHVIRPLKLWEHNVPEVFSSSKPTQMDFVEWGWKSHFPSLFYSHCSLDAVFLSDSSELA